MQQIAGLLDLNETKVEFHKHQNRELFNLRSNADARPFLFGSTHPWAPGISRSCQHPKAYSVPVFAATRDSPSCMGTCPSLKHKPKGWREGRCVLGSVDVAPGV